MSTMRHDGAMAAAVFVLALTGTAHAHQGHGHEPSWQSTLTLDPLVLVPLLVGGAAYALGTRRLLNRSKGRSTTLRRALFFLLGWLALAAALVSPLHWQGERIFAAHMIEHQILMIIAPPLIVLGRTRAPMVWSLPRAWRDPVGRWLNRFARMPSVQALQKPLAAAMVHAAALWAWHLPPLFEAALADANLHWLQHLSFLLSALLFWWTVLNAAASRAGAALLALLVTGIHTTVLATLLTFAARPVYPLQSLGSQLWHLSPLEDQQLAGILMTVPGGMIYLAAALIMVAAVLRDGARAGGIVRRTAARRPQSSSKLSL